MSPLRGGVCGYGEADSDPPATVCGRGVLLGVASFLVGDVSPRTWRRIGMRLSIGIVALSRHRGGGATGPGGFLCQGVAFVWDWVLLWRRIGIRLSIGGGGFEFVFFGGLGVCCYICGVK